MKKGGGKNVIKLKSNWREEIIKAFIKYKMPYKAKIRSLEKAIHSGEAVVI